MLRFVLTVFATTRKLRSPAYFGRLHQAYVFSAASLALNSGKVAEITYALGATEVGESVAKLVETHKPHEAVKGNRRHD